MTTNKQTVQKYMDGFNAGDHDMILSCVTDDVVWEMPGFFHLTGKEAFDNEIENENFVGRPIIHTLRTVEEADIVVAEGTVKCERKEGGWLNAAFCDVFHMRGGKIRQLTSYVLEQK
jgi:ketosteroid isomerase-like protein